MTQATETDAAEVELGDIVRVTFDYEDKKNISELALGEVTSPAGISGVVTVAIADGKHIKYWADNQDLGELVDPSAGTREYGRVTNVEVLD